MKLLPQNEFEYYLTYEGNRSKLIFSPQGWDTDTIGQLARDNYYNGMLRTLSLPINFVFDGKSIIEAAFLKYSFEAEVILEVTQLNRKSFTYEEIYNSELDFSQYDNDGTTVSVILMDGGVSKLIKAKESTKFEYELTGLDVVNMILPGVLFSESSQSIFNNESGPSDRFMPSIDLVINQTKSGFITVQNVEQQENISDESIFSTSDNWFVKGNKDTPLMVKISGFVKGKVGNNEYASIYIRNNSNVNIFQIARLEIQTVDFNVPFEFETDIPLDTKLFIYARTDNFPVGNQLEITEGDLNISYSAKSNPSNCKGIKAEDLYNRIIKRIAPKATAKFGLNFSNRWSNLIITSGNGIREIENAVIQSSFRDFFDTFNSIDSAGFGLDGGVLIMETLYYFFRNASICNPLDAKSCSFTVATDYVANKILGGYNDGNTDDIDGQYEYNSLSEYSLPVTRIVNELDWRSRYRADQYGIEKIRVDYVKKTNDTSSDNDVFMVDCYFDGTDYLPILGSSYTSVTGLPTNETGQGSYNLRITPKKNLLRHGGYIRSIMDKLGSRYIDFASAGKNKELITISSVDGRVAEKDDVLISGLDNPYFKPIIATAVLKLPRNMMQLATLMPFGYIPFIWQGITYGGFILDLGVDLARNTERECKLLLTVDNEI